MGSRFVALLVAVIGVIALAAAGLYLYRHHGPAPQVATGEKPGAEQPKPGEPQPTPSAPSTPTAVPSFDVVRIEPTGEGVIAGRAQPGWTVTVESGGNKIAETKADEEGAWSVVLETPLAAGDHSLALRATSPDATQALTGQQPVQVAVGKPEGEAVVAQKEPAAPEEPAKEAAPATPEEQKPAEAAAPTPGQQAEEPKAVEGQPEPVVPDENAPPPERPKPPVKIGKLDYKDIAPNSGKISMSGVGDPNVHVFFFFDQQPLGDVVVGGDGTWTFEVEKKLGEGEHAIRADTYDEKTGVVAGRASLRLGREPKPAGAAQPESTPAEPSAPVVAERPAEAKPPEKKEAPVVFKRVDYQDVGSDSGKVSLSGTGEPGVRIFLYFDESSLGEVSVGSDGTWVFEADRKLEAGEHKFRADNIDQGTGIVIGSASIGIIRMPKPAEPTKEEHVATAPPQPSAPSPKAATPTPQPESTVAAAEEAKPAASGGAQAQHKRHRPRVYTVRRGDTLWEIAEAYYGGGWHYRAIVRDNRRKIHSPHWIYPKQKFHIPAGR